MSAGLLRQVVRGDAQMEPITVEMYHGMIELGVLVEGSSVELIDGYLVRRDRRDSEDDDVVHGPGHRAAVVRLQRRLDRVAEQSGCHAQCQLPVMIAPSNEPEPDVAIVRGNDDAFADSLPTPHDVLLIAEVAASSLSFDRTTKSHVYASCRIPVYWIVNVRDRCVEVLTDPVGTGDDACYSHQQVFASNQTVGLTIGSTTFEIAVDSILPTN